MSGKKKLLLIMCVFFFFTVMGQDSFCEETPALPTAESFEVAPCFGDNMVFQQNEPIRVWGTSGDEGAIVSAKLGASIASAKVTNGEWTIEFAERIFSSEPQTLEIFGNENCRYQSFENITVGDVWMFIGQSNIEYTTSIAPDFEQFAASLRGDEKIKILHVPLDGFTSNTRWRGFTRYGIYNASALGTFFSKNISDGVKNEIPIGFVSLGYKGKAISSFLPPVDSKHESGNDVYDNVIKYIEKMPVAGIVWYQGEADAAQYDIYPKQLTDFVSRQREIKNQNKYNFPFYVIELAPCFNDENDPNRQYINFGQVRAQTGILPSQIENFHICPTSDLWADKAYSNNLHPNNKNLIAARLSFMVLAAEYGFGGVDDVFPPTIGSISYGESKKEVIANFDHTGAGLTSLGELKGFTLINKNWDKIDSFTCKIIDEDTLYFSADDDICIVRYASETENTFADTASLCSKSGVPAVAFSATLEQPENVAATAANGRPLTLKLFAKLGIALVILVSIYFIAKKGDN